MIDSSTVAFADFRGNKQYVSTGNLMTDNRAALIMVDYPRQARLKLLGRVDILDGEPAVGWIKRLRKPGYEAVVERVYVIRIEAFDWNCQQHITPRFTAAQIQAALAPFEQRLEEVERENEALRQAAGRSKRSSARSNQ